MLELDPGIVANIDRFRAPFNTRLPPDNGIFEHHLVDFRFLFHD